MAKKKQYWSSQHTSLLGGVVLDLNLIYIL